MALEVLVHRLGAVERETAAVVAVVVVVGSGR